MYERSITYMDLRDMDFKEYIFDDALMKTIFKVQPLIQHDQPDSHTSVYRKAQSLFCLHHHTAAGYIAS